MNLVSCILLGLVIACSFRRGYGAADFVSPAPSGSVIANFEGAINDSTLICNVTASNGAITVQLDTLWSFANFRGIAGRQSLITLGSNQNLFIAGGPFLNELTVTNWTSEVDQVIVHCGTGGEANVTLRVYRPPILRDDFSVKIEEGDLNVPINLLQEPAAFPDPYSYEWLKGGQPLRQNGIITNYSSVTFDSIMRSDTGNYTVTATNFLLDNATQPVGSDTGSFSLDVLYPPSFVTQGPTERYVLLGDRLSLVCGTGLDSNPQATITWTAPDGTTIMDNDRYDLENGPEVVRLNFTNTIMSDNGIWNCEAAVTSGRYIVSGGSLIFQDQANIGSIIRDVQLTVIATPGPPSVPAVENIGATWARICWDAPAMANSPISRYQIIGREVGGQRVVTENTTTNATFFNITGLLPATTYSFTVVAISEGGDVIAVSQESSAIQDTTGFTVPEVQCFDPVSADGNISVQWIFIHTGGLDLTDLSAEYSFVDGTSINTEPVQLDGLDTRSVNVSGLVAGFMYTFRITAENSNGSYTAMCTPTQHLIGVPRTPQFGRVQPGSRVGEVTVEIKTVASGVNSRDQRFQFILTPVLDVNVLDPISYDRFDYMSGVLEPITVSGLEPGRSYTFSATAVNIFGTSGIANSPQGRAAGTSATSTPNSPPSNNPPVQGSNTGPIVGGAVGGILAVIIIVAIVIIVVAVLLIFRRDGKTYRPNKAESDVRYQPAPTSESTTQVKEASPDIGEPMHKDAEIQYAELDTFRPPSQQQKNGGTQTEPKPVEPEEPVEYAIITNFKKKEGDPPPAIIETSAVPDPTPDTTTSEGDADKTGTSTTLV